MNTIDMYTTAMSEACTLIPYNSTHSGIKYQTIYVSQWDTGKGTTLQ